jgi:hypothetical protein
MSGKCTGFAASGEVAGQGNRVRRPPGGNQKTFDCLGRAHPERPKPKQLKVFCFFFSKKKALPGLASLHPIALSGGQGAAALKRGFGC